jgi:hypothetical protein
MDDIQRQLHEYEDNRLKNVEFHAASVNAWYSTALEHDKSIFALSAGGIALLVTLLTTVGVPSLWVLLLYGAAIICFLTCLILVLVVFKGNRKHIEEVISGQTVGSDPSLDRLDTATWWSFIVGVVLAAFVGGAAAYNSYAKELKVANEKQPTAKPGPTMAHDSVSGAAKLQKSFNGVSVFQQTITPPAPAPAPATPPAATGGTPTPAGSTGQ